MDTGKARSRQGFTISGCNLGSGVYKLGLQSRVRVMGFTSSGCGLGVRVRGLQSQIIIVGHSVLGHIGCAPGTDATLPSHQ